MSVIGYPDGTDGKGTGAGDGEVLIFSLDCGKGAISYEGNGVRCEFRIEFEGVIAFEVTKVMVLFYCLR